MELILAVCFFLVALYFVYKGVVGASKPKTAAPPPIAVRSQTSAARSGTQYVAKNLAHLPAPSLSLPDSSIYLSSDRWDELLVSDAAGMPTLYLQSHKGRLWLTEPTTGLLVSVGNKHLRRMGIWSVSVRGLDYHKAAVRAGDFRPGSKVRLVREPNNAFDKNAVAVCAASSNDIIGYFNKGMAPGLAKVLDTEAPVEAISVTGDGVGKTGPVQVVAASPAILRHLLRKTH
ncbi:HIRAN domain-containing protein [Cryobacterium arcticum]|uniref:HIRAN domain-containing protein n=1 Tax=Cryobacterium arcticum TaxID=670052 RepID=A0A317ZWW4_9MICO|nr:HIRAN domain-containing protein [Cryobacterium arcticum]PXA71863.1 hypothetical protein CTB96_02775 [Cryobacterium arcticum]